MQKPDPNAWSEKRKKEREAILEMLGKDWAKGVLNENKVRLSKKERRELTLNSEK